MQQMHEDPTNADVAADKLTIQVEKLRKTLRQIPLKDPSYASWLSKLGIALDARFQQQGEIGDLEEAITCHNKALSLRPPQHPDHCNSLNNLANALSDRFETKGEIQDLDRAIIYYEEALNLRPRGHGARASSLNNLAIAITTRFQQQGDADDLDRAIIYQHEALEICRAGHLRHDSALHNLGNSLLVRFQHQGTLTDLNNAIAYKQQALDLRPEGHPRRSGALGTLAIALKQRFEQTGSIKDLDTAVTYFYNALSLRPQGHPSYSGSLNDLANALLTRFGTQDDIRDLDQAIIHYQSSLNLRPTGHPGRPNTLSNLAVAHYSRFKKHGLAGDLENYISYHQQALELCPPGHPDHPMSLSHMGLALSARFQLQKNINDLDQAIVYHSQAFDLQPKYHPCRSTSLLNLADALKTRFKEMQARRDLDLAIHSYTEAQEIPLHHPNHSLIACGLAEAYLLQEPANPEVAFSLFEKAANHSNAGPGAQLDASVEWALAAHSHSHASESLAYSTSLNLLHKYTALNPALESRLAVLAGVPQSLASDAAACAIQGGKPGMAIELLEQGRAILWATMNGLQSPVRDLCDAGHKGLADEFQELSLKMKATAMSREALHLPDMVMGKAMQDYHLLSDRYSRLVESIRMLSGFKNFLKAASFQELQLASLKGPVIILNISKFGSHGLIVHPTGDPTLVPLPDATPKAVQALSDQLQALLKRELDAKPRIRHRSLVRLLRSLWKLIVCHIVDELQSLLVAKGSRIWWCPTSMLCLLPLHAAGPWNGEPNLPDMFISSYTPTLSALLRARANRPSPSTPNLLAIGVPQPHGYLETLENVEVELSQIGELASSAGQHVHYLQGQEATKEAVLCGLQEHSWVHFACHGHQDPNRPFQSCFQLHDTKLSLQDIIGAQLPNAELAVLSACHGATGDRNTPDEVIHLAAGLQFSGFKSVIGTLWPMADEDGPLISKVFYSHMFHMQEETDSYSNAAEGLKAAVDGLRHRQVPMERWVNFVHIGA